MPGVNFLTKVFTDGEVTTTKVLTSNCIMVAGCRPRLILTVIAFFRS